MKAIRSCAVLGVASFLFAACSSGSAGSSCGAYYDKLMALLDQCGAGGSISLQRDSFSAYCDEISTAPGASNFAGQVDTCSQQINTSVCALPSCSIRGTLPTGAACANGVQCASGSCEVTGSGTPTTELQCGTCRALATQGGDCTNAACDVGLYCDSTNKCAAFVTQNGACTTTSQCVSGLICDNTSQTCVTPPTKGQPCTQLCAAPYACINSTCADRVGLGAACPTGIECQANLTCNPQTHQCEQKPVAKSGEACGFVNNQFVQCDSSLVCTNGVCATPKQQGAACTVGNQECATNLVCNAGTCQVPDFSICK